VFFLDPDGMKLEGMRYGERHEQAARARAARKKVAAAKLKRTKRLEENYSPASRSAWRMTVAAR
jgi:hypothetical protein